jgi:hypothetical protein
MIKLILAFSSKAYQAIELKRSVQDIINIPAKAQIARAKFEADYKAYYEKTMRQLESDFGALMGVE